VNAWVIGSNDVGNQAIAGVDRLAGCNGTCFRPAFAYRHCRGIGQDTVRLWSRRVLCCRLRRRMSRVPSSGPHAGITAAFRPDVKAWS
jgi:hypothetical protein